MERRLTPRGAATRARIVDAAAALIRARGVAGTNLDDVRRATSTSKSQLFHYFPGGRAELLLAVTRYEADQVLVEQRAQLGGLADWSGWQRWRRLLLERHLGAEANNSLGSLIVHLGGTSADAVRIVDELFDDWRNLLADGVRAIRPDGEVAVGFKPDELATALLAAIQGGVAMLRVTGRGEYLEAGLDVILGRLGPG